MVRQFACAVLCLSLGAAPPLIAAEALPEPAVSANPNLSVIARAPDFALRDIKGSTVRLSDYRGRVVLVAFVFTTVGSLSAHQPADVRLAGRSQGGRLFGGRQIWCRYGGSETDTAKVLADTRRNSAPILPVAFPARDAGQDPAVLEAYDEWTKLLPKGELDHPARVYLIDRKGNIREIYSLAFFNEKQALIDMRKLVLEPDA